MGLRGEKGGSLKELSRDRKRERDRERERERERERGQKSFFLLSSLFLSPSQKTVCGDCMVKTKEREEVCQTILSESRESQGAK
jgi:hypothetical protein